MWWTVYLKDGRNGQSFKVFVYGGQYTRCCFFFCWLAKENLNGFFHSHQVTDLTLAKENQTSFEEYLSNTPNADPGIDLTVTVLTTGFWPSYKSFDLNLPAEMVIWIFLI